MLGRLNCWIAASALAITLLAGCGGGGTPPNITAAAGGTVTSDDGRVTLVVPPGAAGRDMTVRILNAAPDAPTDIGMLAGYAYAIEGDGGALGADAELRITVDAGVLPAAAPSRRQALDFGLGDILGLECPAGQSLQYFPLTNTYNCVPWPPAIELAVVDRGVISRVDGCRFLPAERRLACSIRTLAPKVFGLLYDNVKPEGSMVISPSPITTAGDVTFNITATDNRGVDQVLVLFTRRVGGVIVPLPPGSGERMTAPPYVFSRPMGSAQNGVWQVRVGVFDKNGNSRIWDQFLTVDIPPGPMPDTTPPTVTLGASITAATVGDTVLLSATADDDVGVSKVEFYRGATKLGERSAAPYTWTTGAFAAGDVGVPQVYTARAFDAAGNGATSGSVTVSVSAVSTGDVYVNAASGIDTNAGTAAAPFKTLSKAFTVVGSGGTVWLQNGSFTLATEGTDVITGRTVPAGIAVRAVNPLGATVGFPVKFAGNGTLSGVQLDASGNGSVMATAGSGTVTLTKLQWVKLGAINTAAAIILDGSVKVTLDTGGDPAHEYVAAAGVASLANVDGNAEFTINGGHVDRVSGGGAGGMLRIGGNAKLTLNGVSWTNNFGAVVSPSVIRIDGTAPTVTLVNTTLDLNSTPADGGGNGCIQGVPSVVASGGAPVITLDASILKRCPGDGIHIRAGTPTIVLKNGSQIANAGFHGLRTGVFAPSFAAVPIISISNSQIVNSARSGVELLAGGSLAMTGATISNNGLALSNGGVRLLGSFDYGLSMRGSTVSDNAGDAGSGGVVMQGTAASVFDLGSKASPGGNTIRTNGAASTGLRAAVAAGVTVQAVGNTFNASAQGANASGQYTSASSVCGGANPCNVTSGSGVNFAISGGTLRLVDN